MPYSEIVDVYLENMWLVAHVIAVVLSWALCWFLEFSVDAISCISTFACFMPMTRYALYRSLNSNIAREYNRGVNMARVAQKVEEEAERQAKNR
jgi:hypothetical protein